MQFVQYEVIDNPVIEYETIPGEEKVDGVKEVSEVLCSVNYGKNPPKHKYLCTFQNEEGSRYKAIVHAYNNEYAAVAAMSPMVCMTGYELIDTRPVYNYENMEEN